MVRVQIAPYTYLPPEKCMQDAREEAYMRLIRDLPGPGRWDIRESIEKTAAGAFVRFDAHKIAEET